MTRTRCAPVDVTTGTGQTGESEGRECVFTVFGCGCVPVCVWGTVDLLLGLGTWPDWRECMLYDGECGIVWLKIESVADSDKEVCCMPEREGVCRIFWMRH